MTPRVGRYAAYYLMIAPALALLVLFCYLPLRGVVIAFQEYSPRLGYASPYVGLEHFRTLARDPFFRRVVANTLLLVALKVPPGVLVPLVLALALAELRAKPLRAILQTALMVPVFLSWVVASAMAIRILEVEGPLNAALVATGQAAGKTSFLTRPGLFRPILVITDLWKHAGWNALIYVTAILAIDESYYRSAEVDGAGRMTQILHITLPMTSGVVRVIAALVLITTLDSSFEQVINLYNPAVYATGDIVDTYVYRTGLVQGRLGPASAAGLVKALMNTVLLGAFLAVFRPRREYRDA